jgi:hypothetical protein
MAAGHLAGVLLQNPQHQSRTRCKGARQKTQPHNFKVQCLPTALPLPVRLKGRLRHVSIWAAHGQIIANGLPRKYLFACLRRPDCT